MIKAYIDNQPVVFPQDDVLKPKFTLRRRDEDGKKGKAFTGNLTFIGEDYDYLYAKLVSGVNAQFERVEFRIEDHCCGTPIKYEFWITAESLEWCHGKCELTAAAIEKSAEAAAIDCLKNTLIAHNNGTTSFPNGFKNAQHPRISYCNEIRPGWHHHLVMVFGLVIGTMLKVLTPLVIVMAIVINAINAVINALNNSILATDFNTIDFDGDPNTGPLQEWQNFTNQVLLWIIGCGRKHPSPLVRNYAINVCEACGLSFQSSIFNSPGSKYFNAVYHFAPVDKGIDAQDTTTYWIDKNEPYLSGFDFFDKLKGLFNAEWTINGNTVTFERKDHFINTTPWLDLTALADDQYEICYKWSKRKKYAYGDFFYQKDAVNSVGSEAGDRFGDIVEWNQPVPNPNQKGKLQPLFEFNSARFRNDGIDPDIISQYSGALNTAFNSVIGGGVNANAFDTALLINQHVTYLPTILIWDGIDISDARVSPYTTPTISPPNVSANQYYNYPMWFFDHGNQSIYGDYTNDENNMYTNFWYIENPHTHNAGDWEYEAEVEMTCARLQAMTIDGTIKTPNGIGQITDIELDYNSRLMKIRGIV